MSTSLSVSISLSLSFSWWFSCKPNISAARLLRQATSPEMTLLLCYYISSHHIRHASFLKRVWPRRWRWCLTNQRDGQMSYQIVKCPSPTTWLMHLCFTGLVEAAVICLVAEPWWLVIQPVAGGRTPITHTMCNHIPAKDDASSSQERKFADCPVHAIQSEIDVNSFVFLSQEQPTCTWKSWAPGGFVSWVCGGLPDPLFPWWWDSLLATLVTCFM